MHWEFYLAEGVKWLFLGIVSYQDLKFREISVKVLAIFGILAISVNLLWRYQSIESVLAGIAVGGMFVLTSRLTKEAIGYGDSLGMVVLGIFMGGENLLKSLFFAGVLSGVYGLWMMLWFKRTMRDTLPFLPFLFLGTIGGTFL